MSRSAAILAFVVICPTSAAAQTGYPSEWLRSLPAGGNVFALVESAQPEVTTDRFNSGGLNAGDAERASAFLASWSQTEYFVGDVAIFSPTDGTPMLFPQTAWWESVDVNTTLGGLRIVLMPPGPTSSLSGAFEAIGSGGALSQSSPSSRPPAISQLADFAHLNGNLTGEALDGKLGFNAGGAFMRATTVERTGQRIHDTGSAYASARFVLSPTRSLRATAIVQRHASHVQSAYHAQSWWIFGAYTNRYREASPAAFRQADRLYDGPIPALIDMTTIERRLAAGARFVKRYTRHSWSSGVDVERSTATIDPIAEATIAERVDGTPARMWRFPGSGSQARRRAFQFTAFASDRLFLTSAISLALGIRMDCVDGSAAGASEGVSWRTLLPSAHLDWNLGTPFKLELATGVARFADRLLLGMLAYGDPNAPTADVSRWDGASVAPHPLVMRVGPGTGRDPAFSRIDPELQRPITDQFILQLVSTPWPSLRLRVTGVARRQSSVIHVVNIGVPIGSYTMFAIPDANADWVNPVDDQQLPVYDRKPEAFGQDRYLLTNPDVENATMGAVVVSAEVSKPRVVFRIGGTASASVGSGGHRGFTALENDQTILGELFTNPNAATYARGRLFNDRAYTIKTMTIVRLPGATTIGVIARYQDGQPFSRLAVVPGLNQGAEAIQTFPRGRSRFAYRATLDVRLQKRLDIGRRQLDLIGDAYNLLNQSKEVEEYVVTGPRFREITAIQPPRSFHVGARVSF